MHGQARSYAVVLFIMGFIMPGVDNFAHAGGFAGGYLMSAFFNPLTRERGDHMLVTVSQGGSGGTAASPLVAVPNVVGQDEQAAQSRLQQAGFRAIVEDLQTSDPAEDGKVVDEQPAAGTKAPKGSQIIIYVGRASTG